MCREFGLVKHSPEFVELLEPRCWSWECDECAPLRKRSLIAQIIDGRPDKMLTLTMQRTERETAAEAAQRMMKAWDRLLKQLRRHHGKKEVAALWKMEKTKAGWPHLHIALRMPFTPHRLLKAWWTKHALAEIVWIERPKTADGIARYMAKYIAKSTEQIGKHKRYSMTRNWLINWTKPEKAAPKEGSHKWVRLEGTVAEQKHLLLSQAHCPEFLTERHSRWWTLGHWPSHLPCARALHATGPPGRTSSSTTTTS